MTKRVPVPGVESMSIEPACFFTITACAMLRPCPVPLPTAFVVNTRITIREKPIRVIEALEGFIQAGDLLIRYDEARIFEAVALRQLTTEGRPGDATLVEIERQGRPVRVYLPRGPLGIRMQVRSLKPELP